MRKKILGIFIIVLICTMILAGCDNGSTNALTAEQQEIKSERLADWAEKSADMKSAYGMIPIIGQEHKLKLFSQHGAHVSVSK